MPVGGAIVVGVDGSPGSKLALRVAAEEARVHGRPLRAVMAHGYLDQHWPGGSTEFSPDYTDTHARAALDEILSEVLGPSPAVTVERAIVTDLPARALLAESAGAFMLVVGARGRGGFGGLLLGSVSLQVVTHATCPVLVVRGPDA